MPISWIHDLNKAECALRIPHNPCHGSGSQQPAVGRDTDANDHAQAQVDKVEISDENTL